MRTRFSPPRGPVRRRAEALFGARALREALAEARDRPTPRTHVGYGALHQCVHEPDPERDAPVREAIRLNPGLRSLYHDLVRRASVAWFPQVAAASSGEVFERLVPGYEIRIKRSEARPNRCYVLIALKGAARPPRLLEAIVPLDREEGGGGGEGVHGELGPVPLPAPVDGIIQLIRDERDPLIAALRDRTVEISLR